MTKFGRRKTAGSIAKRRGGRSTDEARALDVNFGLDGGMGVFGLRRGGVEGPRGDQEARERFDRGGIGGPLGAYVRIMHLVSDWLSSEPEGRTGFAHLFEHMMFEGTPVAPKGTFDRVIEGGGGSNNADTRYDFTEYIDTAPVSALEPVLWLEADRFKTLDSAREHLENQRKVVEEEVRVNVLNEPYGLFYAIDLPGKAFDRFPNAHNFYGDFKDLDAAKIQDVEAFFKHYYAPNNAVMAIAGDVTPADVFAKVEKYFAGVAPRQVPPKPDLTESPQTAERRSTEQDTLARVPAVAIGYRMPPRHSHDAVVGALVGELLHNGQASLLYQAFR